MEIEDIINQEKQKELIRKSKQKQDKHLKKLFYKDCYKMWKDYKKVESPYFWWLGLITIAQMFDEKFYLYWVFGATEAYTKDSWFDSKWCYEWCGEGDKFKIKHKSNPNDEWVYLQRIK